MRKKKDPEKALAKLLAKDPNENVRQVAFADAQGRVAGHTGDKAIISACDIQAKVIQCRRT